MSSVLTIDNLSVSRGRCQVLQGLNLSLDRGEMVALVGPNGSGKTTLLESIVGLCQLQSGDIRIDGFKLSEQLVEARGRVGFMVPAERIPGLLTGRQCLQLFARSRGLSDIPAKTWEQAEQLRFTGWVDQLTMSYSLGTRQKLSILLALLNSPPLILLDEPLNGLDPVSALALKRLLTKMAEQKGCCIVMAIHDLSVIEQLHDHILVLLDGRIVLDWDQVRMQQELSRSNQPLEEVIVGVLEENPDESPR